MYNVIGIWGDGSEDTIGEAFSSWFAAFDWAVEYDQKNRNCTWAAHWYRFDKVGE